MTSVCLDASQERFGSAATRAPSTVAMSGRWSFSLALTGGRWPHLRPGPVADRILSIDMRTSAERRATVDALVELFFELMEAWRIERFVEAGAKEARACPA